MSRETHRRLSLSRRGLTGVALEAGGRSEHLEETRTESKSYRGCARRGVSFLFSSRFSRYVIGRLKFPPSWKTRAKTSSFYRVGETLLARVKLDNFSFQHCKLFATSSLGGGYLPSSTTLYAVTWTIAFRFIPFFLSLPPLFPKCRSLRLCVFLDFYIFSSLVDEKSSRGWQISRTKSFKALIALSSRIVILLLIAYISILSVSLLDVLLEENLTRVVDRSSKSDRD